MVVSNPALKERCLEAAITEIVGDSGMPDLSTVIARATASERRRALVRCEQAQQPRSLWSRRRLQLAAILLASLAVIGGIWSMTQTPEDRAAGQPFQDRVHDPKRVVPKNAKELSKLLKQVVSLQARGCGSTLHVAKLPPMKLDYDIGMDGFVAVEGKTYDSVLARLQKHVTRKQQDPRKDFDPGIRLVLTLRDGRTLHCLIQFNRTMRVLPDKDIDLTGHLQLGNLLAMSCGLSSQPSQVAQGYATQSIDGFYNSGEPMYPPDMEVLQCIYWADWCMREYVQRFPKLQTLDLSRSALTLTNDAFDVEQWRPDTRAVIARLRTFVARGVALTDATAADVLSLMPELQELDLSTCQRLGADTVQAVLKLEHLRELNVSGAAMAPEMLQLLANHKALVAIRLSSTGMSDGQRAMLERSFDSKLVWQTK